jgi:uncharacterized integral membrane protein
MNLQSSLVLTAHAFALWVLCGATMVIGLRIASMRTALLTHAVAAPLIAGAVSFVYFRWFGEASPLAAAIWFEGFVFVLDLVLVALLINRSLDMFRSVLGTWLPLLLIFLATLLTGALMRGATGVERQREVIRAARRAGGGLAGKSLASYSRPLVLQTRGQITSRAQRTPKPPVMPVVSVRPWPMR